MKGLIGFHAFTGKHFVQSFFRNGKLTCWKVMTECFANLVRHASESICTMLEKYVQYLSAMVEKKLSHEKKSVGLALSISYKHPNKTCKYCC